MRIKPNIILATAAAITLGACANAGGLGSVLGGILGGGGQQLVGTVSSVDTRNSQIAVTQTNGQSVALQYDQNTKVVYQNKLYSVSNLENGDQINARVQTTQSNAYYTDSISVTTPAQGTGSTGTTTESVQQLQGTVRTIDRNLGRFTIDAGTSVTLTISMPYRASTTDQNRYNNLRVGDFVRFSGVYLNNSLVELRQFY